MIELKRLTVRQYNFIMEKIKEKKFDHNELDVISLKDLEEILQGEIR